MQTMQTDFHCHLLPAIDDGAKDCAESRKILTLLAEQGIQRVLATPHFYPHRELAGEFLLRRAAAFQTLQASGTDVLPVLLGAEVHLQKGISALDELQQMTWGKQRYLLLELPYGSYKSWMVEEIYNITFRQGITPVIAHLNRYLTCYKKDELLEILEIPDTIIQLNNEALWEHKALRFTLELIQRGRPVIFGSDSHNIFNRAPDYNRALPILMKKLKPNDFQRLCTYAESLLD